MKPSALCRELPVATPAQGAVAVAPEWLELIPAGEFTGRDGRSWDNADPAAIVAAFNKSGVELPIDYDHATELGGSAPAAGWVSELQVRAGAVWGRIHWTPAGAQAIVNREWRYYSPAFIFNKKTSTITALTSVGLTNKPNLFIQALNSEEEPEAMSIKLIEALGLKTDATEEQQLAAVNALKQERESALNRAGAPPSLDKFVPRADYDVALNRATAAEKSLADINVKAREEEIGREIESALKAGKITPATADYHKVQCRQEGGLDRFREFIKAAPVIAGETGLDGKQPVNGTEVALNAQAKKISQMLGVSAEDLKKYGNREGVEL